MKNLVLLAIALVMLSCQQSKVDTKAEGEKLMQLSKEWAQSASQKDVEKTVSYWAEDAILISQNG
jgi:ketosteroid isomerase-like protein